jgi:opacity protein-like surface antigen
VKKSAWRLQPFLEETFSSAGSPVAILSAAMKKILSLAALLLAFALPASAQNWSFGAATGPFVFGDFYERTVRVGTGQGPTSEVKLVLSAETRAGLALDLERNLGSRWAIRAEGTWTRSPLTLEQGSSSGSGATLDAGELDVATFMLPVVFRINTNGALRFHVLAGPAMALYRGKAPSSSSGSAVFEGTQKEWGVAYGGGVGWWISDRFAIEGNLTDTTTSSPFDEADFPSPTGLDIPRTHNVHTTIGVRWKF